MRGNIIKKRLTFFAFEKTPRISFRCKLVPFYSRIRKWCIVIGLFFVCFKSIELIHRVIVNVEFFCYEGLFNALYPVCTAQSQCRNVYKHYKSHSMECEYSLRTTYVIFEAFQFLFPTALLIFKASKVFHPVIWERKKQKVSHL